jgi:PadR family transcriptional regulator PadR
MEPIALDNNKAQMRKGILEYCILLILSRNDAYASEIIAELKNAQMIVVEGTLYPLLMRQKNQGWLGYRWEESPQGPPRKYYSLTEKGKALLRELDGSWREMVSSIEHIREQSIAALNAQQQAAENNQPNPQQKQSIIS